MTVVIDRPRARTARAGKPGAGAGYAGFHAALDVRCELALAAHLRIPVPADTPLWVRCRDGLALAARIVEVHGMPVRHAAARQLLAGYLGVYERFFGLPKGWQLADPAPDAPLTWRDGHGDVVVDVVRTAPPSHPLADAAVLARLADVSAWAQQTGGSLAGVRILSMAAPAASLLHDPHAGLTDLAGSPLTPALTAQGVAR